MLKVELAKHDIPSYDADYVIDKFDVFANLFVQLRPKIQGLWTIILLNCTLDEVEQLMTVYDSQFLSITAYLDSHAYDKFLARHPGMVPKSKSVKELLQEYVATLDVLVDDAALDEIYKRVNRNIELLKDAVDKCVSECKDNRVTVELVKRVIPKRDIIFASQVVYAFLLYKTPYRWSTLDKFINSTNPIFAYNSIRKQIREMFALKCDYLQNKLDKQYFWLEKIDIYTLTRAYLLFLQPNKVSKLYLNMLLLDDSNLYSTVFKEE